MTLIKSVLNLIPIFFFSFFRVPKKVVDRMVRLQRTFYRGGDSEHQKLVRVSREAICLPKERGGLGV